jgi:hypothetical protein
VTGARSSPNRYRKACEEQAPRIEEAALHLQRELLLAATEGAIEGVYIAREKMADAKDPAGSSPKPRNSRRNRHRQECSPSLADPTAITEHRTVDEDLRALRAAGIADIQDADVIEDAQPALPRVSVDKRASD